MNCPSKNDNILLNPTWNESPPRFAADLTTCEDLNGMANARELGDTDRLSSDSGGLRRCEWSGNPAQETEKQRPVIGEGVQGPLQRGPYTRTTILASSEYRAGLATASHGFFATALMSWARWITSVVFTSILISYVNNSGPPIRASIKSVFQKTSSDPMTHRLSRRDGCAVGSAKPDYDMSFHVGGLFIILFVSSTACAFPILVIKFPRLRIPAWFLFAAKHFGTGVLIATAFVHLLPTAFLSLSNPCLPKFWTTDYPAMPGAIMLASIFFVTIIEMIFSPNQHVCGGNDGVTAVSRTSKDQANDKEHSATQAAREEMRRTYSDGSMRVREMGSLRGRMTSISRTLSRYREESQRLDAIASAGDESPTPQNKIESNECAIDDSERNQLEFQLTAEQARKKAVMQCFLLEMGILFHSIFIGMALAVAVGNDFVVLLIAIIFHQTFEGLALGVRIAAIEWPARSLQPWLMALAYGCTTPLGQAIGIATHTLYSPDSEIGLLVVGIMNAVSAGFLVFASLVELMSEDFLSDESWKILRGRKRVIACLLVFGGAALMSLVGAWA